MIINIKLSVAQRKKAQELAHTNQVWYESLPENPDRIGFCPLLGAFYTGEDPDQSMFVVESELTYIGSDLAFAQTGLGVLAEILGVSNKDAWHIAMQAVMVTDELRQSLSVQRWTLHTAQQVSANV